MQTTTPTKKRARVSGLVEVLDTHVAFCWPEYKVKSNGDMGEDYPALPKVHGLPDMWSLYPLKYRPRVVLYEIDHKRVETGKALYRNETGEIVLDDAFSKKTQWDSASKIMCHQSLPVSKRMDRATDLFRQFEISYLLCTYKGNKAVFDYIKKNLNKYQW